MQYNISHHVEYNMPPALIAIWAVAMIVVLAAEWRVFVKAGKHGWAVLIPLYNTWTEFEVICGRGTAMFRLLIPFYNVYWAVKSMIKLAHAFGKSTGFGVGLTVGSGVGDAIGASLYAIIYVENRLVLPSSTSPVVDASTFFSPL